MTHIVQCERRVGTSRCPHLATAYAAGQWVCPLHTPKPDAGCSHSLQSDGRCSYCGGLVA